MELHETPKHNKRKSSTTIKLKVKQKKKRVKEKKKQQKDWLKMHGRIKSKCIAKNKSLGDEMGEKEALT